MRAIALRTNRFTAELAKIPTPLLIPFEQQILAIDAPMRLR
jgi:hypothetical protein